MSAMDDNDRLMAGTLPVDPEDDALPMLSGGARQEPLLFGDAEVPDFPLDALPPWLASGRPSKRCKHLPVCRRCSGSRFFRFTTAKKIAVEIKPGWCEPTNLYVAVALAPGEGKSPIFAAATAPLRECERSMRAWPRKWQTPKNATACRTTDDRGGAPRHRRRSGGASRPVGAALRGRRRDARSRGPAAFRAARAVWGCFLRRAARSRSWPGAIPTVASIALQRRLIGDPLPALYEIHRAGARRA